MSLYNIAQPAGAMVSGAMQGGLSTNLEGVLGRAGWRWAFIINVRNILFSNLVSGFLTLTGHMHYLCRPASVFLSTRICK